MATASATKIFYNYRTTNGRFWPGPPEVSAQLCGTGQQVRPTIPVGQQLRQGLSDRLWTGFVALTPETYKQPLTKFPVQETEVTSGSHKGPCAKEKAMIRSLHWSPSNAG